MRPAAFSISFMRKGSESEVSPPSSSVTCSSLLQPRISSSMARKKGMEYRSASCAALSLSSEAIFHSFRSNTISPFPNNT